MLGSDDPMVISLQSMKRMYYQVMEEAVNYAKTVHEDPRYIRARASMIGSQAFAILSKRIKESDIPDGVLVTAFLYSAESDFCGWFAKFQDHIEAILQERARPAAGESDTKPEMPLTSGGLELLSSEDPEQISLKPMKEMYCQVMEEAVNYAKTGAGDPRYIEGRASIIADQAFAMLSKRIRESSIDDEALVTAVLYCAQRDFCSVFGKFQDYIKAILQERACPAVGEHDTKSGVPLTSPNRDLEAETMN